MEKLSIISFHGSNLSFIFTTYEFYLQNIELCLIWYDVIVLPNNDLTTD